MIYKPNYHIITPKVQPRDDDDNMIMKLLYDGGGGHLLKDSTVCWDSPASDETSEAKEGTFSRGACFLLLGVSHWLRGERKGEISDSSRSHALKKKKSSTKLL